jgi:hypothetical protein
MDTWLMVLTLGFAAGTLTTVAGMGGGLLLVVGLSMFWDPRMALAVTAIPLLIGNVHRVYLFQEHLARRHWALFALGAAPAALIAGAFITAVPTWGIRGLIVAMTLLAVAKATGRWKGEVPTKAMLPGGAVVGALTATAGGGGILTAPLLMASGLSGARFLATASAAAAVSHLARFTGYAAAGIIDGRIIALSLATAAAIVAGNRLGKHWRTLLGDDRTQRLQVTVLTLLVMLSVTGLR